MSHITEPEQGDAEDVPRIEVERPVDETGEVVETSEPKPEEPPEDEDDEFPPGFEKDVSEELASEIEDDEIDPFNIGDDTEDGDRLDIGFQSSTLTPLKNVEIPDIFFHRYKTGIEEIDFLFGGEDEDGTGMGILPGCVITCAGVGGTGKTTFWLQSCIHFMNRGLNCGLFSGEESKEQIKYRTRRMDVGDVPVANEKDLDIILEDVREGQLNIAVIDSFQSLICSAASHLRGKKLQQYMINKICECAKETNCAIIVIMHMTKAGILKGDSCVPHTVDVNMIIRHGFKEYGDKKIRVLDIPQKNRVGPCIETLAYLDQNGYSFGVEVEPVDSGPTTGKTNKRTENKQQEMAKVLAMKFPVTPQMVMTELDVDWNYAYGRLSELVRNGKLLKIGKGVDSIFQVVDVD